MHDKPIETHQASLKQNLTSDEKMRWLTEYNLQYNWKFPKKPKVHFETTTNDKNRHSSMNSSYSYQQDFNDQEQDLREDFNTIAIQTEQTKHPASDTILKAYREEEVQTNLTNIDFESGALVYKKPKMQSWSQGIHETKIQDNKPTDYKYVHNIPKVVAAGLPSRKPQHETLKRRQNDHIEDRKINHFTKHHETPAKRQYYSKNSDPSTFITRCIRLKPRKEETKKKNDSVQVYHTTYNESYKKPNILYTGNIASFVKPNHFVPSEVKDFTKTKVKLKPKEKPRDYSWIDKVQSRATMTQTYEK